MFGLIEAEKAVVRTAKAATAARIVAADAALDARTARTAKQDALLEWNQAVHTLQALQQE